MRGPTQGALAAEAAVVQGVVREVGRRIVGQELLVERLLICLLTGGHVLLEGVPGLAKTLTVRTLAETVRTSFQRIQFTPDLLPADVVGTQVFDQASGAFRVKHGPIFANIVLADEINRAPAKVQAALLEAMQEHQVTIGGVTYRLPEPFLVLATQNPIEQEGTYPLPEALLETRQRIADVYMDERVVEYIVDLVHATRAPGEAGAPSLAPMVEFGASPRATIALGQAARGHAFLRGRAFVTPDDVKQVAPDVLRHRVLTSFEADAEGVTSDAIISTLLATLPAP